MARLKEIWILQAKTKAMRGQERTEEYKDAYRRLRRLMLAELKRENRHQASRRAYGVSTHTRRDRPLSDLGLGGGSPDARSA